VPVYIICPHCEHPQVVPAHRRGRARFCRQCGQAFVTSRTAGSAEPLPISSMGELNTRLRGGKNVYILSA
jgi:transposase-like protein